NVDAAGLRALSAELTYDATEPTDAPENTSGKVDGHISGIQACGEDITQATGTASYDAGRIVTDVQLQRHDLQGQLAGTFQLHTGEKQLDIIDVSLGVQHSLWKLGAKR